MSLFKRLQKKTGDLRAFGQTSGENSINSLDRFTENTDVFLIFQNRESFHVASYGKGTL